MGGNTGGGSCRERCFLLLTAQAVDLLRVKRRWEKRRPGHHRLHNGLSRCFGPPCRKQTEAKPLVMLVWPQTVLGCTGQRRATPAASSKPHGTALHFPADPCCNVIVACMHLWVLHTQARLPKRARNQHRHCIRRPPRLFMFYSRGLRPLQVCEHRIRFFPSPPLAPSRLCARPTKTRRLPRSSHVPRVQYS